MNTVKTNNIKFIDPQKRNVVFDTNVFISALLWEGIPHELLVLAENGILKIFASIEMIEELEDVLKRPKFQQRIRKLQTSVPELMLGVVNLVEIILPKITVPITLNELPEDRDDVMFLECAIAAQVKYLISGDQHLLSLNMVRNIHVLTPSEFYEGLI